MNVQLTETQKQILKHAHLNTHGEIIWFPDHIKGGSRNNVRDSLLKLNLISKFYETWFITPEGYAAIGILHRGPVTLENLDSVITSAEAAWAKSSPRLSKQSQLINLLKRPEGATMAQMIDVTQWQEHTIRSAISAKLKKKLGLEIHSRKKSGSERIYYIEETNI